MRCRINHLLTGLYHCYYPPGAHGCMCALHYHNERPAQLLNSILLQENNGSLFAILPEELA